MVVRGHLSIARTAGHVASVTYLQGPGVDEVMAAVDGENLTYSHADGLNSIVRVTDSQGSVVLRREYDAWGSLQSGSDSRGYSFTGREWDPETALYYYRARYYDPSNGRFISEDPIGFSGGVNFYTYVDGRPDEVD